LDEDKHLVYLLDEDEYLVYLLDENEHLDGVCNLLLVLAEHGNILGA
jgi:hypothetical protein